MEFTVPWLPTFGTPLSGKFPFIQKPNKLIRNCAPLVG